jgi:colanic acid biosynthesis protein WcaH
MNLQRVSGSYRVVACERERLEEAVHRIAQEELGVDVKIKESLGVFQYFYETSEVVCEKRYVAHGFHVRTGPTDFDLDGQHADLDVVGQLPTNLHKYVDKYIHAADLTDSPIHSR